jgi:predicted MPP superfamily phosphohydrolase
MAHRRPPRQTPGAHPRPDTPAIRLHELIAAGKGAIRKGREGRLSRAKLRHTLLTLMPDRVTGGTLRRRHLLAPITMREIELHVPNWPAAFEGIRIGHVSDLHVGDLMPVSRAIDVIEALGKAKPDLLACTGDVIDLHVEGSEPVFEAIGDVRAQLGRFLVLGNHDHLDDARKIVRLARGAGIQTLVDECAPLRTKGDSLLVGGIDWASTIRDNAQRVRGLVREVGAPHLLLAHNPKAFREAARLGVALTLAGHTHGGQISMRNGGHPKSARAAGRGALRAGLYHEAGSHLFVTTGAGSWFPLRVNCPAEVALITVKRAP